MAQPLGGSQPATQTLEALLRLPYEAATKLHLGPLPAEAAVGLVTGKFSETGRQPGPALEYLVALAGGHPQRLAFLADALWHETPADGVADEAGWQAALERALHVAEPELRAVEAALSAPQRKLVRLLAWGQPPTGAAAGHLDLAKGSATAALEVLVERSVALPRDGANPARLIDPLLAAWVRSRQPAP